MTNTDLRSDVWTMRKVATDDFGQEHWDADDVRDDRQSDDSDEETNNNASIEDLDGVDDYTDE